MEKNNKKHSIREIFEKPEIKKELEKRLTEFTDYFEKSQGIKNGIEDWMEETIYNHLKEKWEDFPSYDVIMEMSFNRWQTNGKYFLGDTINIEKKTYSPWCVEENHVLKYDTHFQGTTKLREKKEVNNENNNI